MTTKKGEIKTIAVSSNAPTETRSMNRVEMLGKLRDSLAGLRSGQHGKELKPDVRQFVIEAMERNIAKLEASSDETVQVPVLRGQEVAKC